MSTPKYCHSESIIENPSRQLCLEADPLRDALCVGHSAGSSKAQAYRSIVGLRRSSGGAEDKGRSDEYTKTR